MEYKLIINEDFSSFRVTFWLQEIMGQRMSILGWDGKHLISQLITNENEGIPMKEFIPLFSLPLMMKEIFIKAFLNAASDMKVQTVNENLVVGKMEAMEKHLESAEKNIEKLFSLIDKLVKK